MVNLSETGEKGLIEGLDKMTDFERELVKILRKIELDVHYAEENRERQTSEIIAELQNLRTAIESK